MSWTPAQKQLLVETDRLGILLVKLNDQMGTMTTQVAVLNERLLAIRLEIETAKAHRWTLWLAVLASFAMPLMIEAILWKTRP
jgi:hypothetical protein